MTSSRKHSDAHDTQPLPSSLQDDLRALFETPVEIPAEVDEAVSEAASARLRRLSAWRGRPFKLAAAATVLLAATVAFWPRGADSFVTTRQGLLVSRSLDLNQDGRVDILDGFRLARQLELGETTNTAWDVNQDGRLDQRDVDDLIQQAVALPES